MGGDLEDRRRQRRKGHRPGPGSCLPLLHPESVVSRHQSERHLGRSGVLCRETHGVEVVGVLAARCILTPDL